MRLGLWPAPFVLFVSLTISVPALAGSITYTTVAVPGATSTAITDISNNGVAVGYYYDSSGSEHGFERLADGTLVYPIDAPNGGFPTDAPVLTLTFLGGINNAGTAIGSAGFPDTPFILSSGVFTTYAPSIPGAVDTFLAGIDDFGDLTGNYETDSLTTGQQNHGFIQQGGSAPFLFDFPGAVDTSASGINNLGDVVGQYVSLDSGVLTSHGYVRYADGTFVTVDVPGANPNGMGLSMINDLGMFVGSYEDLTSIPHSFYGTPGNLTLFEIPGAIVSGLSGMNDAGQVVGAYLDSDDHEFGFIGSISSVPEPASVAMVLVGICAFAALRVRRRKIGKLKA